MTVSAAQAGPDREGAHLVLYDGVCGLCNRLLQFLLKHDRRRVFAFAPLQSATGSAIVRRCGGNPQELTTFYAVANYRRADSQIFLRGDAALFVAGQLGWPWKLACAAAVLPRAWRDAMYDAIAKHRYRIFGRYDECQLPQPEFRNRF